MSTWPFSKDQITVPEACEAQLASQGGRSRRSRARVAATVHRAQRQPRHPSPSGHTVATCARRARHRCWTSSRPAPPWRSPGSVGGAQPARMRSCACCRPALRHDPRPRGVQGHLMTPNRAERPGHRCGDGRDYGVIPCPVKGQDFTGSCSSPGCHQTMQQLPRPSQRSTSPALLPGDGTPTTEPFAPSKDPVRPPP